MGKLDVNKMKSKLDKEQQSGGYSNASYDKLVQGKNVRRVLWPKGDSESFFEEGYLHFSLGEEGKSVVTCPKTFNSKARCPVCEYVESLQKSKNKEDKKLAEDIKAKRRIYINVLSRDDEDDEPKVLPIGVTILKGILEVICDPDYGDITDPDEGRDITITRKGQGLKTEYAVLPKPKSTVVSDSLSEEEIEEKMTDLSSLFVEKSYEDIEAVMNGDSVSDDDDEDESEYDDMDIDELEHLCKKRKIKLPAKPTKIKLIALLEHSDNATEDEDDAELDEDEEDDAPPFDEDESDDEPDEDEDDEDDIQSDIAAAIAKRKAAAKNKGKK